MTRLFWKIFFSFWLSMVIIVGVFGWIHQRIVRNLGFEPRAEQMQMVLRGKAEKATETLLSSLQRGGIDAVRSWLRLQQVEDFSTVFIFDHQGRELLDRSLPRPMRRALELGKPPNRAESGMFYALTSSSNQGELYRIVALAKRRPLPGSPLSRDGWWIRLLIAIAVSALVCLLLARYLTRPMRRLSWAAREMGDGNLAARVSASGHYPADELGEMGAEFDRMAERLQKSHGLQRQLLLDVSHELRSPLARLQVATELARKRAEQTAGAELQRIEQESEKLNDLIGEILHLSRQQDDGQPLNLESVDLTEMLISVAEAARIEADRISCQIELEVEPALILDGNPALLERAIENVLRNAVAHSPEKSVVKLSANKNGDLIEVRIEDQGPGVEDKQLEDIFRPFYRVSQARERQSGGFGLGLAIARASIERHNGQIRASNLKQGGLQLTISLPWKPDS